MNAGTVRFFIVTLTLIGAGCRAQNPEQSQTSFEAALRDSSSAPRYVRIVLTDGNTGVARNLCTLAPFLLGALHREHGFAYDIEGVQRTYEVALSATNHSFTFYRADAINNISSRRSPQEFEDARSKVAELLASSADHRLRPVDIPSDWRGEAMACALIEKGYSVGMRDLGGNIYVIP